MEKTTLPRKSFKRQLKFGTNATVYTLFVLGVCVFIELISGKHHQRIDTTKTGRHSLSPQTEKILSSLQKDIKITSFFGERQVEEQMAFRELADMYTYKSSRVSHKNIDPDRNPGETKRYKVSQYGTIILEAGESEHRISDGTEEKLTNAFIKVTRKGKKKVLVLSGHGEKGISVFKEDGFQIAKEALEQDNYKVEELNLLPNLEALEGADVLLVPGPQKNFQEVEVNVMGDFLKKGGKVFLMVDPFEAADLKPFLKEFGVRVEEDIVIDQISQFFGVDLTMPVVSKYHDHAITADFDLSTFFPLVRSVRPADEKPDGVEVKTLLSTSQESWAEADKDLLDQGKAGFDPGTDKKGPVSVGAAVTIKVSDEPTKEEGEDGEKEAEKKGKLVVFGDSDFATNSRINMVGNRDLFLNVVSWLAEESDLISIRPKESGDLPMPLSQQQQRMVFFLPVIVWPLVILIIGVAVFRHRRRLR